MKSLILDLSPLIFGTGLSYLHPKEIWEFSQRSMTVAYPIFASCLSVITFLAFAIIYDICYLIARYLYRNKYYIKL